uniref:Uncharacterized protein n=1 Tax=Schistocephalus solidus TaxID=70667 RepID=A0A0V0J748_SCHSO
MSVFNAPIRMPDIGIGDRKVRLLCDRCRALDIVFLNLLRTKFLVCLYGNAKRISCSLLFNFAYSACSCKIRCIHDATPFRAPCRKLLLYPHFSSSNWER